MKPTFLFVNCGGESLPLAIEVKNEGNKVYLTRTPSNDPSRDEIGTGLLSKDEIIDDIWEVINNTPKESLYIVVDDNAHGQQFDHLKNEGYKVIGGGSMAAKIEHDRSFGTKIMEKIGMSLPHTEVFDSLDKAIEYVKKQPEEKKMVFKPEGEAFAGSSYTYTSKNGSDLYLYMEWIKNEMSNHKISISKFLLQDFIEGVEADFEATFDGEKFMKGSVAIDIEKKKSGDGEKGEATGCMGQIEFYVEKSRFFDKYMKPLEPLLKKHKFTGPISVNCIFDEKGNAWPLEYTPRYGWDATISEVCILKKAGLEISDWLMAVADKKDFAFPHNLVSCAIRVYSGSVGHSKKDVAGRYFSFHPKTKDYLYFYGASYQKECYIVEDNPPLVVSYADKSIKKSIEGAYKIVEKVYVPDRYYRMEVGNNAAKVVKHLIKHNWIG